MSGAGVTIDLQQVDAAGPASWWAEQDAALAAWADREGPPDGSDPLDDGSCAPSAAGSAISPDDAAAWAATADPGAVWAVPFAPFGGGAPFDAGALSETGRVDALVALERARGWVDAHCHRVLAALAPEPIGTADKHWVSEEIACALRQSPGYVTLRLHIAHQLTTRLGDTLDLLQQGVISPRHAEILALAVLALDDTTTATVQARVLPRAGRQTSTRFAAAVRRAVHAADPRSAECRHIDALRGRRVSARPADDGMGDLYAHLRLDELAHLMDTLDATARATRRACADDTRTLDQLRADALVDLVLGRSPGDGNVAGDGDATGDGRAPVVPPRAGRTGIQVVVAATTLLGLDDQPADIDGYGPIPAGLARLLAHDPTARWRRLLTDPTTGHLLDHARTTYHPPADLSGYTRARDRTCRFPTCARRAATCETDHLRAWSRGGHTDRDNCQSLCARHHHLKHEAGWQVTGSPERTPHWTSPTGHTYRSPPGSFDDPARDDPAPDDP